MQFCDRLTISSAGQRRSSEMSRTSAAHTLIVLSVERLPPPFSSTLTFEQGVANKPRILQWAHGHTGEGTVLIDSKKALTDVQAKFPEREARTDGEVPPAREAEREALTDGEMAPAREAERDELTEGEMGPARDAETDDDALREAETLREPDTLAPKVGDRVAEGKRDAEPLRLAVGDSPAWHCT